MRTAIPSLVGFAKTGTRTASLARKRPLKPKEVWEIHVRLQLERRRRDLALLNLAAVQLLLGHTKLECTIRYLGIEVDDALAISEQVEP